MRIDRIQVRSALVVLFAAAIFAAGLWWPTAHQINQLRSLIAEAEKDLLDDQSQSDNLSELTADVETLRQHLGSRRKVIPNQAELAGVLRELSVQIEAAQLTGQGITTMATVAEKDYVALPVELTFTGESPAVWRFIRQIEQMPRLMQIESLKMSSDHADADRLQVTLRLTTYFSPAAEGKS